jgi:hypothetical protein
MAKPDNQTLIKAVHHIVHDYANLMSSGTLTQPDDAEKANIQPPVNTHIQHAFLLNCRKLADFFNNSTDWPDDIIAKHFTGSSEKPILKEWDYWGKPMDKQLAHLTYTRVTAPVPWDGYKANRLLLNEFQAAWKLFLNKVQEPFEVIFDSEISKKEQSNSEFKDLDLR